MNAIKHATFYAKYVKAMDEFRADPVMFITEVDFDRMMPTCETYRVELKAMVDVSIPDNTQGSIELAKRQREAKIELTHLLYGEVIAEVKKALRAIRNCDKVFAEDICENILDQLNKVDN
jgi:hypothetical protein